MKTENIITFAQAGAELAVRAPTIRQREEESTRAVATALKQWQREKAREWFEISLAWNHLHEFVHDWQASLDGGRITYIVDAWFLQDLIRYLTPGQDEEITYVTGVALGRVKILSRICGVTLEKQSVVYARATAKSCTETLAQILERGNTLHVMAHSHPGRGAPARHRLPGDFRS
jgi:hypothetical protein